MESMALDHVAIRSADVASSVRFYQRVLGLEDKFSGRWGGVPVMMLHPESGAGVAIFPAKHPAPADLPGSPGIDHFAFRVSADGYEAFKRRLGVLGLDFDEQDHDICISVYLRDPDGNKVEVTTYRPA